MRLSPLQFYVIGFLLVLYGMVMPFLMVLGILEPTFFLSFTSYAATFTGVLFGVIGAATYVQKYRGRK